MSRIPVARIEHELARRAIECDRATVREGGLRAFVELAWTQVEPLEFVPGWHIDEMCTHLEAVSRGECRRLLINIPPGMSKSLIVSVLWPAWDWTFHPSRKFIAASYNETLSHKSAKLMRDLVLSDWYCARWPDVRLRCENSQAVGAFKNASGGFRFSPGAGSGITGWHADIHIVDDPLSADQCRGSAASVAANLDKVWSWYRETLSSRAVNRDRLARVVVMQRLHEQDLAGRLLAAGDYTHLCLPLEYSTASQHRHIILPSKTRWGGDRRNVEGELLCPGRLSAEGLPSLKTEIGTYAYTGQYAQQPPTAGGAIIHRGWMTKFYEVLPVGGQYIQSWDMAFKSTDTSSYVVGQCWYYKGGAFYLVDQVREQMGFSATLSAIQAFSAKHPRARAKLVEAKANGSAVVDVLNKKLPGLILIEPEGGKEARLHACSPLFEAGNVWLPDPQASPWVNDYIEELCTFPGAAHDDQADSTSQALNYLTAKRSRLGEAMKNAGKLAQQLGV